MDHSVSMKPPAAASSAASSARRWVLATSICAHWRASSSSPPASSSPPPATVRCSSRARRRRRGNGSPAGCSRSRARMRRRRLRQTRSHHQHLLTIGARRTRRRTPDCCLHRPRRRRRRLRKEGTTRTRSATCSTGSGWRNRRGRTRLYDAAECPFLSDQVACRRNGRPDSAYERWRWQPKGCGGRMRRLGGAEALELCRDKRLVLVGDSLNRNMWESLACILYAAVPDRSRTRIIDDAGSEYRIFRAMDYNCSVEFFWSPFLVKLETKEDRTKALMLDQLPPMLQPTLVADVLVFNTGHWWTHTGKLRAWDHLEWDGKMVQMAGEEAFDGALKTWARWVDNNIDPRRTRLFFRSASPEHKSVNWCYNQTAPISKGNIAPSFPKRLINIIEKNIKKMKTPIIYMNITRLSELRIDAHPSIYTITREGKPLSKEQQQQPLTYSDCT